MLLVFLPPRQHTTAVLRSDGWPLEPRVQLQRRRQHLRQADPDNTVYLGTAGGGVWKTTDAGKTWLPKGDHEVSLAIGAISVDPSNPRIIYAGTGEQNASADVYYGRGLLRSDDGGDSWTRYPAAIYTIQAGDTLSGIVAGPLKAYYTNWHDLYNDNRDIIGPDPNNIKTGAVLRAIFPFARHIRISQIVVDDKLGSHLILGTSAGLWESTDQGVTWALVPSGLPGPEPPVNAVLLDTAGAKKRLYVAFEGKGIYTREDADPLAAVVDANGKLPAPAPGRIALAMLGGNHQILYAAFGRHADGKLHGIYKSINGGTAWDNVPSPAGVVHTDYNFVIAVHPTDATKLYLGEVKLRRSRVAGGAITAWDELGEPRQGTTGLHDDQHAIAIHPTKADTMWVGNDGGVWLSVDGGTTWAHRNRGLQTMQFYTVAEHPTWDSVLLAGAQDNGPQRGDGGPTWLLSFSGDSCFTAIDPKDPNFWYHGGVTPPSSNALRRSDVAGNLAHDGKFSAWTEKAPAVAGQLLPLPPFAIDPSHPVTLFLGFDRLYKLDSHGDVRAHITPATFVAPGEITAITVASADVVYVGTRDGKLYQVKRPVPAAQMWTVTNYSSNLPASMISDIAVDPADVNELFVTISTFPYPAIAVFGISHVWHAADITAVGFTWDDLGSVLPTANDPVIETDNPANSVAVNPNDSSVIVVGCDLGVYRSDDGGTTWVNWSTGLPNSPVMDIEIHKQTGLVRAATHGRGVWERPINPLAAAGPSTDIYLRENAIDAGRRFTPPPGPMVDPFDGSAVSWDQSPDIKVDTADEQGNVAPFSSTVDYTAGGAIDYLGFQALKLVNPRRKIAARVFIQVHNRGSRDATNIDVRQYSWAA